jgi:hypothetical protein
MPAFITRLNLSSGTRIQIGEHWPGETEVELSNGNKMPAPKVGLIIDREEVATPEDEGSISTRKAYYEVWLMPDELRDLVYAVFFSMHTGRGTPPDQKRMVEVMSKYPNIPCREVKEEHVVFVERGWAVSEAWDVFDVFFESEFPAPDEAADKSPQHQPARLQAPNGS